MPIGLIKDLLERSLLDDIFRVVWEILIHLFEQGVPIGNVPIASPTLLDQIPRTFLRVVPRQDQTIYQTVRKVLTTLTLLLVSMAPHHCCHRFPYQLV